MFDKTTKFSFNKDMENPVRGILRLVCLAMKEKGYDPMNQLVGYIVSGDPTYITSYNDARKLISRLDRDQVLEEIVSSYIEEFSKD
ncbi:MAG: IreB family regulatory phosphoprotein [Clostridiales bacterium]|nr:IreB family regulatory phosphoprotein [Clostridiales bacterium]MBR2223565.1 IreB family regulatory phosphoprotein [Christensenellaceae bacterium]